MGGTSCIAPGERVAMGRYRQVCTYGGKVRSWLLCFQGSRGKASSGRCGGRGGGSLERTECGRVDLDAQVCPVGLGSMGCPPSPQRPCKAAGTAALQRHLSHPPLHLSPSPKATPQWDAAWTAVLPCHPPAPRPGLCLRRPRTLSL